jgi:hypothetical protein
VVSQHPVAHVDPAQHCWVDPPQALQVLVAVHSEVLVQLLLMSTHVPFSPQQPFAHVVPLQQAWPACPHNRMSGTSMSTDASSGVTQSPADWRALREYRYPDGHDVSG